jgi:hypothetical protein
VDLKLGGIAAVAAFALSFLIGLVSQSTMPLLIIRPFIFAAIFFVLFIAAKFLLGQFMPELFDENSGSNSALFPGSMVNIMEGDNPNPNDEYSSDASLGEPGDSLSWQAPNDAANAARPDDSDISLGDISALSEVAERKKAADKGASNGVLAGMDQNMEDGYTGLGDLGNISQSTSPMDFEAGAFGSMEPSAPAKPAKKAKPVKSGSPVLYSDSDDSLPDLDSMAGVFAKASTDEEPETADFTEPSRGKKKSANKDQALEGDFSPKDMAEGIRTVLKKDKEE